MLFRLWTFAILPFAVCGAQSFEAASIKPAACGRSGGVTSPGGLLYTQSPLRSLLATAFDVKPANITGPAWLGDACYDVNAKFAPETDAPRRAQMLRRLLEERLGLSAHVEVVAENGFQLTVARGGAKLTPAKAVGNAAAPSGYTIRDGNVELRLTGRTMDEFASGLDILAGRPTVNATGLAGAYDVTIVCDASTVALFGSAKYAQGENPGQSFFTALRKLGLELVSAKVPVRRLFVEKALRTPIPD